MIPGVEKSSFENGTRALGTQHQAFQVHRQARNPSSCVRAEAGMLMDDGDGEVNLSLLCCGSQAPIAKAAVRSAVV